VGFATCAPDDVGVFRSRQIVKSHASFLSRLVRPLVLPVSHDRYTPDSGKFDGPFIIRRADCVLCSIISVISSTPSAPGAVTARKCMRRAKGIEEMVKFRVDFTLTPVLKRERGRHPGTSPSRREAGAGIEPANRGFADPDLTTWLPRRSGK
jgi:hypothetical protein